VEPFERDGIAKFIEQKYEYCNRDDEEQILSM